MLGSSLEEHALGVHWNVCENQLRYAVRGPDRPMTKRGLLSTLKFRLQSTQFVSLFALHARLMASRLATCQDELLSHELDLPLLARVFGLIAHLYCSALTTRSAGSTCL